MRNPLRLVLRVAPVALLVLSQGMPARSASLDDHPAVPAILARAEAIFQSMKARDYPEIFAALSAKSRETIVEETSSAIAAAANQAPPPDGKSLGGRSVPPPDRSPVPDRDVVRRDFIAGGPIARDYWNAFLRRFDPDDPLERSRWEMGTVEKERAEILLTRHGADRPAQMKMFLEGGAWKVGLVETFWSR